MSVNMAAVRHYTKLPPMGTVAPAELIKGAFIAGAAWQAERPEKACCDEFDAMRQDRDYFKSQVSDLQAKLDAMTGERDGWQNSAKHFSKRLHAALFHIEGLEKDTSELAAIRTAAVKERVTVGIDPAAPGSDRTVIAVCKAYERAMDDMGSFGIGVVFHDEDGNVQNVDLKEFLADKPEAKSEATGGFTATGEAAGDPRADNGEMPSAWYPGKWTAETFAPEKGEAGHSDQVRDLKAQLAATEGYMKFYKALAASRARSSAELSKMIDDLLNLGG